MLDQLRGIVCEAGEEALRYFRRIESLQVETKANPKDLVTEADRAVERFLFERLGQTWGDYGFWGEETGQQGKKEARWVVDPIDGTHSFVRRQYFWSISVALEVRGNLELGVVLAPRLGDLYSAEKGAGATKNGKRISVSKTDVLAESMVATGFACLRADLEDNNLDRFQRIAQKTMGQRRFGSAALDLCLVADGQLDAFWEQNLAFYDVAAGSLIVEEAGGLVTDFKGVRNIDPTNILASNPGVQKEILGLL